MRFHKGFSCHFLDAMIVPQAGVIRRGNELPEPEDSTAGRATICFPSTHTTASLFEELGGGHLTASPALSTFDKRGARVDSAASTLRCSRCRTAFPCRS